MIDPMRRRKLTPISVIMALLVAPAVWAEIDYPPVIALPDWDVSVGATGGVALGENRRTTGVGPLFGVDVGVLHGVWGLHAGVRGFSEGNDWRVGGLLEVSAWYLLLFGVGWRVGGLIGSEVRPSSPAVSHALTVLVGVPLPIAGFGQGDSASSLVVVPFARPGLRFINASDIVGYHEFGVMLRWTSFGFGR